MFGKPSLEEQRKGEELLLRKVMDRVRSNNAHNKVGRNDEKKRIKRRKIASQLTADYQAEKLNHLKSISDCATGLALSLGIIALVAFISMWTFFSISGKL